MKHWPADKVERRPVADLQFYARNARTHSDEQVAQIAASIREWGWTVPVLIDERGEIIAGHGRVMAAQRLGLDDVPVMVAEGWTEAQRRERVFFCAIRNDIDAPPLQLAPKHRWVSAGEACADLQVLTDSEQRETKGTKERVRLYLHTPQGKNMSEACKKLKGKGNFFTTKRLHPNQPSGTLTSEENNVYHWSEPRRLTYREWKRLGSFPDDYQAKSDKIGKYMIGMSVPPKMTEAVARAVIDQWLQPKQMMAAE